MFQRNLDRVGKRVVWRMSSTNPAGVYLTSKGSEPRAAAAPLESFEFGFRASAFELSSGAAVIETEMDALPADVIDQFSRARG